jgi:uncharacterized RDD family membrane protein YckC
MALEDRYVTATPEGVSLSVVLAGVGSRFSAYLLDFVIQVVFFVVVFFAVSSTFTGGSKSSELVSDGFLALVFLLDFIGYFVVCELIFSGRSIGKRAAGLRVVRVGGAPVGFWSSVLRNILRLIDWIPFPFYLVGCVLIFATTQNQRLGDLAGNTLVVRERTAAVAALQARPWADAAQWVAPGAAPTWVPPPPYGPGVLPPELAHWDVSAVAPQEVMLAGMFLANRYGYTPEARAALGLQLANRIWPQVAGAPATLHPEQFLEAVVLVKSTRG